MIRIQNDFYIYQKIYPFKTGKWNKNCTAIMLFQNIGRLHVIYIDPTEKLLQKNLLTPF